MPNQNMIRFFLFLFLFFQVCFINAEDGSQLWFRYEKVSASMADLLNSTATSIKADTSNETIKLAVDELQKAIKGFTDRNISVSNKLQNGSILLITPNTPDARRLGLNNELKQMHQDGYIIRQTTHRNQKITIIASPSSIGLLYGTFHWIRQIQTADHLADLNIKSEPRYDLRMLNHWDNLDGTIERGYAGYSLWKWDELPGKLSPRYAEYARANASIGINATVPNSVNADPLVLTPEYLVKLKDLADVFRPWGVQLFISVNFASPAVIGGLPNSDPLEKNVQDWWKAKAKEIYTLIPDFGGFLVKANSEGQPGPMDYGRNHVDGANLLAEALKPHGGIVIWRAFVYNPSEKDRALQAYIEFVPHDGAFADNVVIQVKNGPIDFQPREPFSPLFGAMDKTSIMMELQITQEYTGFSNHLVFLAPQNEEALKSDTYARGEGSTVAKVTDGTLIPQPIRAIAGVANIGEDANWCGHHFAQSNWYAFGRQAWDHTLASEKIADEWIKMTFTSDPGFVEPVKQMMLQTHEAVVNYMMPLGMHHLFAWGHHYGPEPWCDIPDARPDWLPRYYHNASEEGIGFDRTRNGSGAVDQYFPPINDLYNDINTCPESLLLWFHHVTWNHTMKNGRSLWDEMAYKYQEGVDSVRSFQKTWDRMEPFVDEQRFKHVQSRLRIQARDAVWWRDAIMLYFQTYSQMPIPYELERPVHDLEDLKKIQLDLKHHN
jgi:alpha-glucuronidase